MAATTVTAEVGVGQGFCRTGGPVGGSGLLRAGGIGVTLAGSDGPGGV
jgi:hypothetical protein